MITFVRPFTWECPALQNNERNNERKIKQTWWAEVAKTAVYETGRSRD